MLSRFSMIVLFMSICLSGCTTSQPDQQSIYMLSNRLAQIEANIKKNQDTTSIEKLFIPSQSFDDLLKTVTEQKEEISKLRKVINSTKSTVPEWRITKEVRYVTIQSNSGVQIQIPFRIVLTDDMYDLWLGPNNEIFGREPKSSTVQQTYFNQ